MKLIHARYVVDLFKKLHKHRIGTTRIQGLARKMCDYLPQQKANMLTDTVVRWKLQDAERCLKKARYDNTQSWRREKQLLEQENVVAEYEVIWSCEKSAYARALRQKLRKKTTFLKKKQNRVREVPDEIEGILIADQDVSSFTANPRVYGGTEISAEEESVLSLPPNYTLYEKIDPRECEIEVEKSLAKARWTIREKEQQAQNPNRETQTRRVFDHRTQTFTFAEMRGPDMPFNKRITLPSPLDIDTEVKLRSLGASLKRTIEAASSDKVETNLTKQQHAGLKKLDKRIKNNEIVVFQTDKSGRFAVDTPANYLQAGEQHTANDEVITREEYLQIEDTMNAHSTVWMRMLRAGVAQNDQTRCSHNMVSKNCPPPPFYTLRKDHKVIVNPVPELPVPEPPTRPVCGASQAPNGRLSYVMNLIVGEVWKNNRDSVCLSTEEMCAEIDRVNQVNANSPIVIGSTDVKALYPSLDIDFTVSKVCEVISQSTLRFEGLWYEEIALYVAVHTSQEDLQIQRLDEVCPSRTTNRGSKPTVKSLVHSSIEKRYNNWRKPSREPDELEKRALLVAALAIGMKHVMKNHTYNYANTIKRQARGGPIGLDLTGSITQVYVIWWNNELRRRLTSIGISLCMKKCYVDDVNYGLPPTPPGARYLDGELYIEEALTIQDTLVPDDERTMRIILAVGNDIHESTQLEYDCPSKYDDNKMPILDLKVWVNEENVIMHEFYAKDVSSKAVVHCKSALPENVKRTVLSQEGLRRLLNCSRQIPWDEKAKHLTEFSKQLQFSGYNKSFRFHTIASSIKAYNTLRTREDDGERPLYRPRSWNESERREEKSKKKNEWFQKDGEVTVLFVPPTPNSMLTKALRVVATKSEIKMRIAERSGTSLKRKLQRSNPFKPKNCDRDDCFICQTGGKGNCDAEGVTYNIECEWCGVAVIEGEYIGQSSQNAYTRGKKHLSELDQKLEKSVLWKHARRKHDGVIPDFRMNVTGVYRRDTMIRQISEAVRINEKGMGNLMNDKTEWQLNHIPRLASTID